MTLIPEIIYNQNQHTNKKQEHDQEHNNNNNSNNKKDKKNEEDKSKEDGSGSSESESDSDSDDEDDRNGGITIPVLEWVKGIFPRIVPLPQSNSWDLTNQLDFLILLDKIRLRHKLGLYTSIIANSSKCLV